ncbi:MAG: glycosyltransferase [Planctomycetota bacterium]
MRVLLVSHDFLPNHPAGTEIYTWQLGCALKARGHEVHVFTTEKDVGRPNLRVDLREYGGLPVHELVNNLFYNDFRETWDYPPAERSFGVFLDDLKPDVVHFMHLLYLSVGCVEEVTKRGLPVIYTLHDYWLQCPRFGQRVHADKSICHDIDFARCAECLSNFKYKQTRTERATAKVLASLNERTGINLAPAARRMADLVKGHASAQAEPATPEVEQQQLGEMHGHIDMRDRELRRRLIPQVYRFLAPSRFLRDSFLAWGIPPEKIKHSRAGIDLSPFEGFERRPGKRLRIAFIGTLAPHKGPHVLLEAWDLLPAALRNSAELLVYGPKNHNPSYVRQLEAMAERCGAELPGGLRAPEVAGALAKVDCLVVPSVWYENSPLIILEALATRTPLLVSNLGGMAELVEPGLSGFHFEMGNAADLARVLQQLMENPKELKELYPSEFQVKGVDVDAEELEALYEEAREAVRGSAG